MCESVLTAFISIGQRKTVSNIIIKHKSACLLYSLYTFQMSVILKAELFMSDLWFLQ